MPKKSSTLLLVIFLFGAIVVHSQDDEIMSNQDVISLTSAGLTKTLIIQKIDISKTNFDLSTKALIRLKRARVADDVLAAMLARKNSLPAPATTEAQRPAAPIEIPSTTSQPPAETDVVRPVEKPAVPTVTKKAQTNAQAQSDEPQDPVCLNARLDPANTNDNTKYLCMLVRNVTSRSTPIISARGAHGTLMELFVTQLVKRNKLFASDEDKKAAAKDVFLEADKKRTDKQVGGGPGNAGTTSLAVKGGGPSIIGWAVEHGAATSSINGNTVTVRINPFGLARALQGEGFLGTAFLNNITNRTNSPSATKDLAFNNNLRKFSTSFSFDVTRGQETPTFIVSKQQLSAFSVRYEFINQRNPQSREAQKLFSEYVSSSSADTAGLVAVADQLFDDNTGRFKNAALQKWIDDTNGEIAGVKNPVKEKIQEVVRRFDRESDRLNELKILFGFDDTRVRELVALVANDASIIEILGFVNPSAQRDYEEAVRALIEKRLDVLPVDAMLNDGNVRPAFEKFAVISMSFAKRRSNFLEELNKGTVATFEYTNHRETNAPDTSNFRFIWENGRFLRNTDFTLNASLTMYNKKPVFAGVKRFRDFQFALQTDTSLGDIGTGGNTILTFAGKYERLNGDTIDALGVLHPNTKGDTAIGQFKFTIPIGDWGIKLPLSMTFANRTDLIKESKIRANFGFTFDLDPILARIKPF